MHARRSAFTLVEMLVTTMVMLIMVLAMSQMFSLMGRHVTDGRALMEMQGQLRTVGFRLQEDLDGVTILARQSPGLEWEMGYFEYIEGVDLDPTDAFVTLGNDMNPWWVNDTSVPATHALPYPSYNAATAAFDPDLYFNTATNPNTDPNPAKFADPLSAAGAAYGDIDDVLMFTARSTGKSFVGRIQRSLITGNVLHANDSLAIESHDAEIIYWTQWTDSDNNFEIDLGEMTLHRRVLLIRPDLNRAFMPANAGNPPTMTSADLADFHNRNDLSVHPEVETDTNGVPLRIRLVPNTLKDLAKRENRVAHLPNIATGTPAIKRIIATQNNNSDFPLIKYFPNRFQRAWVPLHFGDKAGEDIVQTDLLAFDVKAYDPTAELRQFNAGGDLLAPGEWGWHLAIPGNNPPGATVGQGAFVDLGYGIRTAPATASVFSDPPHVKSGLQRNSLVIGNPYSTPNVVFNCPTYDTWTWAYEHDGFDQTNGRWNPLNPPTVVADEGTDGIDSPINGQPATNGVDDLSERETSPPYVNPLTGIKITVRVIELDSRQVRQSSIISKFMPE